MNEHDKERQDKESQKMSNFQNLIKKHNELVEIHGQCSKDLQIIDEVAELSRLYLPNDGPDGNRSKWMFGELLMTIRKNLLKEQKEVSQEISEGEIWKYVG